MVSEEEEREFKTTTLVDVLLCISPCKGFLIHAQSQVLPRVCFAALADRIEAHYPVEGES